MCREENDNTIKWVSPNEECIRSALTEIFCLITEPVTMNLVKLWVLKIEDDLVLRFILYNQQRFCLESRVVPGYCNCNVLSSNYRHVQLVKSSLYT